MLSLKYKSAFPGNNGRDRKEAFLFARDYEWSVSFGSRSESWLM